MIFLFLRNKFSIDAIDKSYRRNDCVLGETEKAKDAQQHQINRAGESECERVNSSGAKEGLRLKKEKNRMETNGALKRLHIELMFMETSSRGFLRISYHLNM